MPDEPVTVPDHPLPPKPPETQVAFLQGGPLHGRIIRVQTDHQSIDMDAGGTNPPATYQRTSQVRPDGLTFEFVNPKKT